MPSERVIDALTDIGTNIDLALGFLEVKNRQDLSDDVRTLYANVRCLEIISKASRRLPADMKARNPQLPWKRIAGAGNIYRHNYEMVVPKVVWDTVRLALPELRDFAEKELRDQA